MERWILMFFWRRAMKKGELRLPIADRKVIAGPEEIIIK